MHYKVIAGKDVFKTEPSLRAIPQFNACTSQELTFIFTCYDYDGPFKKLQFPDRLKQAALAAGYTWNAEEHRFDKEGRDAILLKSVRMRNAKEYFMNEIQKNDSDFRTMESYNSQMEQYNEFLSMPNKKPSEMKLAMQIQEKLIDLQEKKQKLAEIVGLKEEFMTPIEVSNMSTIDKVNAGLIS